jgi:hypothetical protein
MDGKKIILKTLMEMVEKKAAEQKFPQLAKDLTNAIQSIDCDDESSGYEDIPPPSIRYTYSFCNWACEEYVEHTAIAPIQKGEDVFLYNPHFNFGEISQWEKIGYVGTELFYECLQKLNPVIRLKSANEFECGNYRMILPREKMEELKAMYGPYDHQALFDCDPFGEHDYYVSTHYQYPITMFIPLIRPVISINKELKGLLWSLKNYKKAFKHGDVVRILPTERILGNERWASHVGRTFMIHYSNDVSEYFEKWLEQKTFPSSICDESNIYGINYLPEDLELC